MHSFALLSKVVQRRLTLNEGAFFDGNKRFNQQKPVSLSCVDSVFKLRCRKVQTRNIYHQKVRL